MALYNRKYYESGIKERFSGEVRTLLLRQLELFYTCPKAVKRKVAVGESLILHRENLLHGIFGELSEFDFAVENGFVATDFTDAPRENKIKNGVGVWKFSEDIALSDYIRNYSGFTVAYTVGRGPEAEVRYKMIPYHCFDKVTEEINNDENLWMYWGEKTKEVSFLPSLVSEKRKIAFILNFDSECAREMRRADIWNPDFSDAFLEPFLDYRYYPKFLALRSHPTAQDTDRESAVMFGFPAALIEGVFVGRKIERDEKALCHIKEKLPDCYIVGLDGKVLAT